MSDSRQHLDRLVALWRRERATTRERFAEERRSAPLSERVARGVALNDLEVDETDAAAGGRTLLWLRVRSGVSLDGLRVGNGDPVRLWRHDPDSDEAVLGVVARRRGDRLGVVVDGDTPDWLDDGGFRLDTDDPQATFDRGQRALRRFADARTTESIGRLREVLFGDRAPELDPRKAGELAPETVEALNPPQQEAVRMALSAYDVALVHGPPGTGKTTTLAHFVAEAVRRGDRVLATAASNTAVDNLAEKLTELGVDVVRLGHPARVSEALQERTLDALLERSETAKLARRWIAEANAIRRRAFARMSRGKLSYADRRQMFGEAGRLFRDARKQLRGEEQAILARHPVVAATAAGADAAVLGPATFDTVVVDEATQAPDPIALVAIGRGERLVLAGDPCQLPPTVIDPDAEREGLGTTLFERLAEARGEACRMLIVQHRMHAELMRFPSDAMYRGALEAHAAVAGHRLEDLGVAPDPLRPGPLVFVDTAGKGWEERRTADDPSTTNPGEAERTAAEVRRLLSRGLPAADVAVITPYWAQVRLLTELLADEVADGLEIGTVDGFQGREKEAVVVDLVRSNEGGDLGFLTDTRRMNVALTRARRFLLVVGDSATLGRHPFYEAFMQAAETAGAWVSAWNDDAEPLA